jgi:hypothetical protein
VAAQFSYHGQACCFGCQCKFPHFIKKHTCMCKWLQWLSVDSTRDCYKDWKMHEMQKMVENAHGRGRGRHFGQKQSRCGGKHMTMLLLLNMQLQWIRTQIDCQLGFLCWWIGSRCASLQLRACHKVGSRRTKTLRVKCGLILVGPVNFDNVTLQWQPLVGCSGTTSFRRCQHARLTHHSIWPQCKKSISTIFYGGSERGPPSLHGPVA